MPSVTYQDYPEASADHPVGRQPVGVRHPSRAVRARGAEARREARRHRSADDAARASGRRPSAGQAGHRRGRRAGDPPVSVRERLRRRRRFSATTRAAPIACASAPSAWTIERAAEVAGIDAAGARAGRDAVRRRARRRSFAAAGVSSAIATAATPRWRCWRCRRSAASSACAAAATR